MSNKQLKIDPRLTKEGILGTDNRSPDAANASPIAEEWLDYFKGFYKEYTRSGSRVICNPAPTDTDDDYILRCVDEQQKKLLCGFFTQEGFENCSQKGYKAERNNPSFGTFRKDDLNFIVTADPIYYTQFVRATKLATKLNLLKKEDRVSLFKAVSRNDWSEFEEEPKSESITFTNGTWQGLKMEYTQGEAMGVLPDVRELQRVQIDRAVNPPVLVNNFWQADWGRIANNIAPANPAIWVN